MADKAAQDMQAMKLRDRSEESAREEVRVLKRNPHLKIFLSSPRLAETIRTNPRLTAVISLLRLQVYEAIHIDGNPNESGHTVTTGVPNNAAAPRKSYETVKVVGNGSFGVVFQATCVESGDTVAIKKGLSSGTITPKQAKSLIASLRSKFGWG